MEIFGPRHRFSDDGHIFFLNGSMDAKSEGKVDNEHTNHLDVFMPKSGSSKLHIYIQLMQFAC